jgi:hypothetical protein
MAKRSWKSIAMALGERMSCHAFCESHSLEEADPKNCPFCDDRAAYGRYLERLAQDGQRIVDPFEGGTMVPIQDLFRDNR